MRYDTIVDEWFSKDSQFFEAFLKMVKNEDYKEYVFDNSNMKSWDALDSDCQRCIFAQINKYKDHLSDDDSGRLGDRFKVRCDGIPRHYIAEKAFETLGAVSSEQRLRLLATRDPVAWAELYAFTENGKPWRARDAQKTMLRCTSSRVVFRCGRRLGKCLSEDTPILTPKGVVPIRDIKKGDLVYAYNQKTKTTELVSVKEKHDNGVREVCELINNQKVYGECTDDHRWLVAHERSKNNLAVRPLSEFYKGVMIKREFVDIPFGEKEVLDAYALGALLGDGCSRQRGRKIYISSDEEKVVAKVARQLGAEYHKRSDANFTWTLGKTWGRGNSEKESVSCSYYDEWCKNKYAHEKICVLSEITTWNRTSILEFLAGLLDTDGFVKETDGVLTIGWSMQAKPVIDVLNHILFSLLQYEPSVYEDSRDKYKNGSVWSVVVRNNLFSKKLLQLLDPYLVVEKKKWKDCYADLSENNTNSEFVGIKKGKRRLVQTYDLEIDTEDHLFLTGHGLVTHNSDALMIKVLFNAINLPNRPLVEIDGVVKKEPLTFLIITPRQTHSDNLYRKFEAQIQNSSVIRDSITSFKQYPYIEVYFQNGSKLFIMTAGTGGANAGLSIRSFSADYLILDEGNYLGPEELKAALAILSTNAHCKLIVSSTPVGIQDFFYRWCFNAPDYKEFHFPTPILDHWKTIKSNVYQDIQSVDDFMHEYMAEFSAPGHTVFRMDLLQKAIKNYEYREFTYEDGMKYSIGIDWNAIVGTEIIVVGYQRENDHYTVVESINVPRSEWTQLSSCEAVIEAIKKWNPFIVVADEGYGSTQIEILRATAYQTNDPRLQNITDILLPYNFSSKIEIFDPVTKKPIKKSAKPFLVKNAVARFEEENISISNQDRLLIEQLSLYQIKSMSNLGLPTYWVPEDDIGDHRLDALMLALVGFKMKQSFLFENGGSVSDVGYIPTVDITKLSGQAQKRYTTDGYISAVATNRAGAMQPVLPRKVGRTNVSSNL